MQGNLPDIPSAGVGKYACGSDGWTTHRNGLSNSSPIRTTCDWWPGTLAMAYNGDQLSRQEIVQDSHIQWPS